MYVLEFGLPAEFSGFNFAGDGFKAMHDGIAFGARQHADFMEHLGVDQRTQKIMPPEPPVERDGFGELRDIGAGAASKASTAGDGRDFFHAL